MDELSGNGIIFREGIMSEYPPQNPGSELVTPHVHNGLATTGASDIWALLLLAGTLTFLGIWMILYVGKKSDSHHKDD